GIGQISSQYTEHGPVPAAQVGYPVDERAAPAQDIGHHIPDHRGPLAEPWLALQAHPGLRAQEVRVSYCWRVLRIEQLPFHASPLHTPVVLAGQKDHRQQYGQPDQDWPYVPHQRLAPKLARTSFAISCGICCSIFFRAWPMRSSTS